MLGDDQKLSLKDTGSPKGLTLMDNHIPLSYTKTNKLITGLYMVTDIMDKEEPLRNKLRTLGTEIITDIESKPAEVVPKINSILSFLEIGCTLGLISEMNAGILKKEFLELKGSILEYTQTSQFFNTPTILTELFKEEPKQVAHSLSRTRIGVQKASTLIQALSDKTSIVSNNNFDVLKKERRYLIITLIKDNGGSATITDIKTKAQGQLATCGEKTIQRELILMVKEGVLKKTGEKRWSRYFLTSTP